MNINENNKFQLIDDYLAGGMNQDELDSFKAFMQSDKDLAFETAVTAELAEASTFKAVEGQLRSTLEGIRKDRTSINDPESDSPNNYKKLAIVAALLGLLSYVLLTFFNPFNSSKSHSDQAQYAMVEPLQLSTKSADNESNLVLLESLYNKGDYAGALAEMDSYLKSNPKDLDVMIAKGIALTETQAYLEAHKIFSQISSYNPRVKKHLWFDAVAYAKEGKTTQAITILNNIIKDKSYNHEYAKAYIARID